MIVYEHESLSLVLALEKSGPVREVIAVAGFVAVGDGALEPCNVEPIRAKHWEDYHHPFQQTP